jgi:hypothetical protein
MIDHSSSFIADVKSAWSCTSTDNVHGVVLQADGETSVYNHELN